MYYCHSNIDGRVHTVFLPTVPDSLSIQKSPLLQQRAVTASGIKKRKKKKRPPSLSAPTFEGD